MLRVTITDTPIEQRWRLQGQLVEPWVSELKLEWKRAGRLRQDRKCVVDLGEVTLIDKCGEHMLRVMIDAGSELIAYGVYTRHVVEDIKRHSKRRWRNPFACW